MADRGKYVVLKYWVCDCVAIVFPAFIEHREFVQRLGLKPEDVLSAGFVSYCYDEKTKTNTQIYCSGESKSLGVKANPERDSKLVLRLFKDPFWDD